MGAPPVVVGLLAALLLPRSGPLGALGWMYTPTAMVAAQVAIALPLVVGITLAAVGSLADDWELQVRALGIPAPWRLWPPPARDPARPARCGDRGARRDPLRSGRGDDGRR